MAVKVDRGKFRLGHEMRLRHERGFRPVIHDARDREFGGHAALRSNLGHARRTFFSRVNLHPAAAATLAAAALRNRTCRGRGRLLRDEPAGERRAQSNSDHSYE